MCLKRPARGGGALMRGIDPALCVPWSVGFSLPKKNMAHLRMHEIRSCLYALCSIAVVGLNLLCAGGCDSVPMVRFRSHLGTSQGHRQRCQSGTSLANLGSGQPSPSQGLLLRTCGALIGIERVAAKNIAGIARLAIVVLVSVEVAFADLLVRVHSPSTS